MWERIFLALISFLLPSVSSVSPFFVIKDYPKKMGSNLQTQFLHVEEFVREELGLLFLNVGFELLLDPSLTLATFAERPEGRSLQSYYKQLSIFHQ